jgi:hypothetical protein
MPCILLVNLYILDNARYKNKKKTETLFGEPTSCVLHIYVELNCDYNNCETFFAVFVPRVVTLGDKHLCLF